MMTMNNVNDRRPVQRLAGLLMTLDIIPGIIGLATEYWLTADVVSSHLGLWKKCDDIRCHSLSLDHIPEWYNAVRGLGIMALCLHAVAVVTGNCCAGLASHDLLSFSFLTRLEEGSAIVAGVMMVGGLTLFARLTDTHPFFASFHLDWSFWLCVAHVCLLLACGVVIALARDDCACWWWCAEKRGRHQRSLALLHPSKCRLRADACGPVYLQRGLGSKMVVPTTWNGSSKTAKAGLLCAKDTSYRRISERAVAPATGSCEKGGKVPRSPRQVDDPGLLRSAPNSTLPNDRPSVGGLMLQLQPAERHVDYYSSLEGIPHLLRAFTHDTDTKHCDPSIV